MVEVIESVMSQQSDVVRKLKSEQEQLELELDSGTLQHLGGSGMSFEHNIIYKGIPEEAMDLDCPDENLRSVVLEEFHLLDRKYQAHLEFLELKYNHVLQ